MPTPTATPFEQTFFYNELNRLTGSGGEILIKGPANAEAPPMRLDVGDRLIGIGVTHTVESLSRPPGLNAFVGMNADSHVQAKCACRAFDVATKTQDGDGFTFTFTPLSPEDYSATLALVSGGRVNILADTIPQGTVIISFLDSDPTYTLETVDGSPGENWARATKGARHWNVGMANDDDFWMASFPGDDLSLLATLPSGARVGSIRFGLSLLSGGAATFTLQAVPGIGPSGITTYHHFSLSGAAAGTGGLNTPFPIGLRT